jgi:hypothetical protein
MAGINDIITAAATRYGVDPNVLTREAQIESGLNPSAVNPTSHAAGLFQFMPSTAAQYGLTNPLDAEASATAAAKLTRDNIFTLRSTLGRDPTPGEIYLAHQQGAHGALKLLGNPDAPAASLVGEQAVVQNGGRPNMTGGQFAQLWTNRFDRAPNVAAAAVGAPPAAAPSFGDILRPSGPGAAPMGTPSLNSIAMQFMQNSEAQAKAKKDAAQAAKQAKLAALFGGPAGSPYG